MLADAIFVLSCGAEGHQPRETEAAQELVHPAFLLHNLPQGIGFRRADRPRIAHLRQQLGDDIVVVLDLDGQDRRADEVLEGIDDAVEELEDEERLDLGGRRDEEQEVRVSQAEDESRRVRVGEVDEVRPRCWMLEIEGQQMGRR